MATFSSNTNRSDSTEMYNSSQTRLRTDRLDDAALQRQILSIQEQFGDIDPDLIALIFHECDYNTQTTIARIKAGDFEDGGWQTAKSNNKKKNHNLADQVLNGGIQSDSERSLSQRTSPTSSLRGERQRKDYYQYSRTNTNRRGNYSKPINSRYPPRMNTKPTEVISSSKTNEEITPTTSSSTDEYEFIGGTSQSLTFDNSLKKSSVSSFTKRRTPSSIPQEPVSMHPTIQFSIKPMDIQFGDIQWNDSIPITITPSNSPMLTKSLDEQPTDAQDNSSTNIIDSELRESTNRLSSSSFDITNNSTDETSHLSDQLIDSSQQQQITSTSNPSPTSQTTNPFLLNTINPPVTNSSAFTPYSTPSGTFQSIPRDYPQAWNQPQSTNYKPTPKLPMVQTGNYPQQTSYQLPQQQIFLGNFPYATPALYPLIAPVDPWSNAGYDHYSTYQATNYLPTYPAQQQYHPTTKHEQHSYDKDYFHYGQNRLSTTDIGNSSQSTKDAPITSKLSATAASFSQATSPATTLYFNPVLYTVPPYYASHQDRTMTYPSTDNRDNRNGASYGGNNRNHYHHQQQQRSHNNFTRHSQQ
jgi:hypothetical protein